MNGQWMGPYAGTTTGLLVLNLDDVGHAFLGDVFAYNAIAGFPATIGVVNLPKAAPTGRFDIPLFPIEKETGNPLSPAEVTARFPGVRAPMVAHTDLQSVGPDLTFTWNT